MWCNKNKLSLKFKRKYDEKIKEYLLKNIIKL